MPRQSQQQSSYRCSRSIQVVDLELHALQLPVRVCVVDILAFVGVGLLMLQCCYPLQGRILSFTRNLLGSLFSFRGPVYCVVLSVIA